MELDVGVTIRQLLLHVYWPSKFKGPGHAGMSSGKSLLGVPNDELCTRLWLAGHQLLLSCQITVAVGEGVQNRATINHVGKQVPLVVVRAKSTRLLLYGVYLKTNSEVCGNAYSYRNNLTHLVKFTADASIDDVGKGFTIGHANVICVLKALYLRARHTFCHRLVTHIYYVVGPWDWL